MMEPGLVSVICLSHQHRDFIREAVDSVLDQTWKKIELILVDDDSHDGSREVIQNIVTEHPGILTVLPDEHLGNCRAFNLGLELARGEFIIDLAADDLLLPERISEGIKAFEKAGPEYGVHFTDVRLIDPAGKPLGSHFRRDPKGRLLDNVPEGDVYADLLGRYFISAPSMMIRREVFDRLGGYDESLAYEDFDFWIRSARDYKYCYTDAILVKKRILQGSLSARQYKRDSDILRSTLKVCLKAERLNRNERERHALMKRARYEFRKALFSGNRQVASGFAGLLARQASSRVMRYLYHGLENMLG